MKRLLLFFTLVLLFNSHNVEATHVAGANITYISLGPNQYRVRLTLFRDCSGATLGTTASLGWRNNCGAQGQFTAQLLAGSGVEIPTPCSDQTTRCSDPSSSNYGIEKYEYDAVLTLPNFAANCQTVLFSYSLCCRNNSATLTGQPNMYVEAMVNNSPGILNNSAYFSTFQVPAFCILEPVNVILDGDEIDGDSLVYVLTPALTGNGVNAPYQGGYTPAQFATTVGGAPVVNQNSGNVSFISTQAQNVVMVVTVTEYRAGVMVGRVSFDAQLVLGTGRFCNNITPSYQLDSIARSCSGNLNMTVRLNTNVECNTVTSDGSELRLYDPDNILVPIVSVLPDTCTNGRTRGLRLTLGRSMEKNGPYYLVSRKGNDGDTFGNQCQKFMVEFDTAVYIVTGCPDYKQPMRVINVSVDSTNHNASFVQWADPDTLNYNWFGAFYVWRRNEVEINPYQRPIFDIFDPAARIHTDYYAEIFPKDSRNFYRVNLGLTNLVRNPLSNELGTIRLVNDPLDLADNLTLSMRWSRYEGWLNPVYHVQFKDLQRELLTEWNPTDDNNETTDTSVTFTKPILPGMYLARVYTRDPISNLVSFSNWTEFEVKARDVKVPNVVTPNGDGVNDAFVVENLEYYTNGKLKVFNRWGQVVFESNEYKNDWIPSSLEGGTYYYQLAILMDVGKTTEYKGALQIIK